MENQLSNTKSEDSSHNKGSTKLERIIWTSILLFAICFSIVCILAYKQYKEDQIPKPRGELIQQGPRTSVLLSRAEGILDIHYHGVVGNYYDLWMVTDRTNNKGILIQTIYAKYSTGVIFTLYSTNLNLNTYSNFHIVERSE